MTTPPPIPPTRTRSLFVTLLAWIMMLVGVLGLPISVITVAMILVKSYGTQTSDPLGFVIIVLGPSMMLITGFGLLKRWRWARGATIALLALVIISNAWDLIKGPRPTTTTFDSSGVPTTTMGSGTHFTALPIIGVCAAMMLKLFSQRMNSEFQTQPSATPPVGIGSKNWRVGHRGRDMMYYEEKIAGTWHRLDIDGEMLTGRAHHVIYFASAETWQSYPEWAKHRRSEIIQRIKSEFRVPDYEYQGGE